MRVDRNPPFGSFHANLPIFIVNYFSVEAKLFKNCNICDPGCQVMSLRHVVIHYRQTCKRCLTMFDDGEYDI